VKKIILIMLLSFGGYQYYNGQLGGGAGAFDASGNAQTLLFTFDGCGAPCNDAVSLLTKRDVTFENINLSDGDEQVARLKSHGGGSQMPVLIAGEHRVERFHPIKMVSTLAEVYGPQVLSKQEARVMAGHFDKEGSPRLVMYGTQTCGFCTKAAKYFNDSGVIFADLDIDKSNAARKNYDLLQGAGTPLIYVGFRRVDGFNKTALDRAIKAL